MAEVHGSQEKPGIKLFGKLIGVEGIKEAKEEKNRDDDANHRPVQPQDEKIPEKIIPCPRCKSMETKFCYFNNYNVNQPRHFCKGCHRYWTAGGALRNVPVGAGRRKARPLCQEVVGYYSENSSLDNTPEVQFDNHLDIGMDARIIGSQGGHVFPAKRRRRDSEGQLC